MFKLISALAVFFILSVASVFAADQLRISKEDVKEMMGNPKMVILDVRQGPDYTGSDKKIQGAVREEPQNIAAWMNKFPKDRILVSYCS
jgi:rhodanese-related sulfurtransferase